MLSRLHACTPFLAQQCAAAMAATTQLLGINPWRPCFLGPDNPAWPLTERAHSTQSLGRAPPPARHAPWTPTRLLEKRKVYSKRMRHLITVLEQEQVSQAASTKEIAAFTAGDILEVRVAVPENDRKVYTYKGVCIGRANKGIRSWFKIYNVFPDAGGFVQHFPLYMPDLQSVRVLGRLPRARRSKLYHLLNEETERHTYQATIPPPTT